MRCAAALSLVLALSACASSDDVGEGERRINELARERRGEERFPILTPLPSSSEVVGEGIPQAVGEGLLASASQLAEAQQAARESTGELSTEAVAAELRGLVEGLRDDPGVEPLAIDRESLGFPTPPPAEE